jgi:hypothetical protein
LEPELCEFVVRTTPTLSVATGVVYHACISIEGSARTGREESKRGRARERESKRESKREGKRER